MEMGMSAIAVEKPQTGEAPAHAKGVKCQVRLSVHTDGTMRVVLSGETARRLGISAGTLAAVAEIDGNIMVDGTAGSGHAWQVAAGIGVMMVVPAADVADMGIVGPQAVGVVTAEFADGTLAFELPGAYYGIKKRASASNLNQSISTALPCSVGVGVRKDGKLMVSLSEREAKKVGIREGDGAVLTVSGRHVRVGRHQWNTGKHWYSYGSRIAVVEWAKATSVQGITPGHRLQTVQGHVIGGVLSVELPSAFFSVREEIPVRPEPKEEAKPTLRKALPIDPLAEIKAALEILNEAIASSVGAVTVWQDGDKVRARVQTEVVI